VKRIGLVVHPSRDIDGALATLGEWAGARGIEVVFAANDVVSPGLDAELEALVPAGARA
jgi:hypothetical protein